MDSTKQSQAERSSYEDKIKDFHVKNVPELLVSFYSLEVEKMLSFHVAFKAKYFSFDR